MLVHTSATGELQEDATFLSIIQVALVATSASYGCRLRNVEVQWLYGNPLDYDDLTAKIDVTRYAFLPCRLISAALLAASGLATKSAPSSMTAGIRLP